MGGCCSVAEESIQLTHSTVKIRRELARGGFSEVFLGHSTQHPDQLLALKRMNCNTPERLAMAKWEINITGKFHHKNIISLLDSYIDNRSQAPLVYLLFPFYEKGSLQDMIDDKSRLQPIQYFDEDTCFSIFLQICEGVKQLHSHSPPIAHRDLKPANVLLSRKKGNREDDVVIMDFGSSAFATPSLKNNDDAMSFQERCEEMSSVLFRAPELFYVSSTSVIDQRTDVWSLGCILYNIAFLSSPFNLTYQQNSSIQLATMNANIDPPPASHPYGNIVIEFVRWMLNPDAAQRPYINDVINAIETKTLPSPTSPPSKNANFASFED